MLAEAALAGLPPNFREAGFPPGALSHLTALEEANFQLPELLTGLASQCAANPRHFADLFFIGRAGLDSLKDRPLLAYLHGRVLRTYLWSSRVTECGTVLPWIDTRSGEIQSVRLEPGRFPNGFPISHYWPRLQCMFPVNWGRFLQGNDVPMAITPTTSSAPLFPVAENVDESLATADALLDEATTHKKWTIPPGALVQLPFGPFTDLEVHEIQREVYFVCRTSEHHFYVAWINPELHICSFEAKKVCIQAGEDASVEQLPNLLLDAPTPLESRVEAAVKLLLAAVIRDFWVVEQRETVFTPQVRTTTTPRINRDVGQPQVIYLPRVKYARPPDIQRCQSSLGQEERRAHQVTAHLRKTEHPSEHQLVLAHLYGFEVPTGFTFVRAHERGTRHREVLYRSRSALHSLYTAITPDSSSSRPSKWFRFERNVHDLMRALGFSVQHIAAARRGDAGVDVYATKGSDLDQVNWIIQCKCNNPKRKVAPAIIRDAIGTLTHYPPGTRAMVVTTSTFSPGAVAEAAAGNVRLIDGKEFLELVASVLGSNDRPDEPHLESLT
jgi:hypothetical protein